MLLLYSSQFIQTIFPVIFLFLFCTLVPRLDTLWEARKQAEYLEAVDNSKEADLIVLGALQCKYKPLFSRPIKEPNVLHGASRLDYIPSVHNSWSAALPHI